MRYTQLAITCDIQAPLLPRHALDETQATARERTSASRRPRVHAAIYRECQNAVLPGSLPLELCPCTALPKLGSSQGSHDGVAISASATSFGELLHPWSANSTVQHSACILLELVVPHRKMRLKGSTMFDNQLTR